MDHIAYLNRKYKLLDMILSGVKTIESRWYVNRVAPWNRISEGDSVYFKDSGCPVTAKAIVAKVIQYDSLSESVYEEIFKKYGKEIGIDTDNRDINNWMLEKKKKNYCILVFLTNVEEINPFNIDKTGFGNACAWITLPDVRSIATTL